jgi:hypothetical protein
MSYPFYDGRIYLYQRAPATQLSVNRGDSERLAAVRMVVNEIQAQLFVGVLGTGPGSRCGHIYSPRSIATDNSKADTALRYCAKAGRSQQSQPLNCFRKLIE